MHSRWLSQLKLAVLTPVGLGFETLPLPPKVQNCVHHCGLGKNEDRQCAEIYGVNATVDSEVAQNAEQYQEVNAHVEPGPGMKPRGETNEGSGGKRAAGDQHETSVQLGLFAPVDGQGKRHGERRYIQQSGAE